MDDFQERTEPATERRRREARQKGNVARSVDLTAAGVMLATATALFFLGGGLAMSLAELLKNSLGQQSWITIDSNFAAKHAWDISGFLARNVLPFLFTIMAGAVFFNFVQVGFLVAPDVLQPNLARLNPVAGAKRILSVRTLAKLGGNLGKLLVVAALSAWWIAARMPRLLALAEAEPPVLAAEIGRSLAVLAFLLAAALVGLALLDFLFQKWKYEQDLRMTKQELREELRTLEGDPLIHQRRREAHRKLAQAREAQRTRAADVLIESPPQIAIAIQYDPEASPAPMVIAKGLGETALRMREIAIEHGIPVIERRPLARALCDQVNVGQTVPAEMYEVFVEIMAYVYQLSGKKPSRLK
jgi:flagellar biosynthetic protein FlhB